MIPTLCHVTHCELFIFVKFQDDLPFTAAEKCLDMIRNPYLRNSKRRQKEDIDRWMQFAKDHQITTLEESLHYFIICEVDPIIPISLQRIIDVKSPDNMQLG